MDTTLPQVLDELGEPKALRLPYHIAYCSLIFSSLVALSLSLVFTLSLSLPLAFFFRDCSQEGRVANEHSSLASSCLPKVFWRSYWYVLVHQFDVRFLLSPHLCFSGFVDMCVEHIPSPMEAARTKVKLTIPDNLCFESDFVV